MVIARKRWWEPALVAAFAAISLTPSLGKPFDIDEPPYLEVAQHIRQDPLHPFNVEITWFGRRLSYTTKSNDPPLFYYLLAGALSLVGEGERPLRLCLLPLDLISALSLYALAARWLKRPLLPTLIAISGPAYLINMGHLMGEKAGAALGFSALAALLRSFDDDHAVWFWGSAGLLALAPLAKFHSALFFLPAAAILYRRRAPAGRALAYLAAAAAPLAAYLAFDVWHRGGASMAAVAKAMAYTGAFPTAKLSHKLRSLAAFTGGCGVVTVFWPFLARRPSAKAAAALGLAAFALYAPWLDLGPAVRPMDRLTGALFAAGAFWTLRVAFEQARAHPDGSVMAAWAAAALAMAASYWSVTSRLVFFALPPLIFCLAAALEGRWPWPRLKGLYAASLVLTAALTAALAHVDAHYARAQRDFALDIERTYLRAGRRVWYTGAMGLHYYLSRAGARGLDVDRGGWDLAKPDDVVLVLKINSTGLKPRRPVRATVRRITVDDPVPLRLMSGWTGEGGFYSNAMGFLPFSLSREPLEEFSAIELL